MTLLVSSDDIRAATVEPIESGLHALMAAVKARFDPQAPTPGTPLNHVCAIRIARAARTADGQVRALRLLPADVSQLPAARPGNGFAARTHLHDARRGRRPHRRSRHRSSGTSTPVLAAWRAKRRARPACGTPRSSNRHARRSNSSTSGRPASAGSGVCCSRSALSLPSAAADAAAGARGTVPERPRCTACCRRGCGRCSARAGTEALDART